MGDGKLVFSREASEMSRAQEEEKWEKSWECSEAGEGWCGERRRKAGELNGALAESKNGSEGWAESMEW